VELFFNELSMAPPAVDRATARAWFLLLQATVQAAVLRGFPHILRKHLPLAG
jgi:hypothetical protein